MPAYSRHSPGANSFDTFVTSHSSRMDDYDAEYKNDGNRIQIDYDEQRINYNRHEDYNLKIHCHNEDTMSMNDSSASSRKSLESSNGRHTRSQDLLHYM